MKFKAFKMAQVSQQWPAENLINMHSSNPEPFTWDELSELTGTDLCSSIKKTQLGYESTQGNPNLRSQISQHYHSKITAEQITLTSGAQEGIFVVMHALLNAGDEVITFTPGFEPLAEVAKQMGAQVNLLPLDAEKGWQINWQQLEDTISHQTKLLVINFPHNPTGAHLNSNEFKRIIALCEKYDCWLLSDEVFRGLEHDPADRLPTAADCYEKAISMGVVSKSLALPGIRLGWIALPNTDLLQQVMTVKSHLSICQSSLDAQICQQIIPHSELIWQRNTSIITENKTWLEEHITNHPILHWHPPEAAGTGFVQLNCDEVNYSATQLSIKWAQKHGTAVMPNEAFLTAHTGFRLTLGRRQATENYQKIMQDGEWP